VAFSSPASRNAALARRLWQYSEQALGIQTFGRPESGESIVRRQA